MRNTVKRLFVLMLALSMTLSLAACKKDEGNGGGSDGKMSVQDYEAKMKELEETVTSLNSEINSKMSTLDMANADDIKQFKTFVEDMKKPLNELAGLQAPEKYAAAQAKYKSGCEAMVKALDAVVELVDMSSDPENVDQDKLTEVMTTMQEQMEIGSEDLLEADKLIQEAASK